MRIQMLTTRYATARLVPSSTASVTEQSGMVIG